MASLLGQISWQATVVSSVIENEEQELEQEKNTRRHKKSRCRIRITVIYVLDIMRPKRDTDFGHGHTLRSHVHLGIEMAKEIQPALGAHTFKQYKFQSYNC